MRDNFDHKVVVPSNGFTNRPNHLPMEGGALNAGYTPVDALCTISNILGSHGLVYGKDWWWIGFGTKISNFGPDPHYNINLSFKNIEHIAFLKLHNLFKNLEDMENV
mgnify:FL=1